MAYYRYKLIGPSGSVSSGLVRLPYKDVLSAITHLERDGSMTIFVKKLNPVVSGIYQFFSSAFKKKVSRIVQAEILSNLSLMLRAGLPLTTALEESAASSELSQVSSDLSDMIVTIQGGATFSEAANQYKNIFPITAIYLIRIGEETGKLDHMLKDASEHLKRVQAIISDTKQALMYPAFVFLAMGAGLLFWFYYVVPKIISLFKDMDVKLPTLTVIVLKISEFIQEYVFHLVFGFAIGLVVFSLIRQSSKKIRRLMDLILLKLPIVGTIISSSNLAYVTEYFSLLINAGIDILRSLSILQESVGNEIFREKLKEVRENITRGESIADSFKSAIIFPNFVTRMIGIGEMSGNLSEQLAFIAEEYRKKLAIIVATLGKAIEPIVLVVAGAMFAIIIGALMLPIYDLVGKISGGG